MPTLYRQRILFEKQLLLSLRLLTSGQEWKLSGCALFNQSGDYYQDAFISVGRNTTTTNVVIRFKPMALDPILWDILDIPGNHKEPLSFRTWGAFTCSGVPIFEASVESGGESPREVAEAVMALCNDKTSYFATLLAAAPYSRIVAEHPYQRARGAFAITLVTSLIHDGNFTEARTVAEAVLSGALPSSHGLISGGKSFHACALEWLDTHAAPPNQPSGKSRIRS